MMRFVFALIVPVLMLVASARARADDSIVVLPLRSMGSEPLAAPSQQRLRTSLQGGLAAAHLVPVDAEPSLVRAPSLRGCETTACLGRLAELANAPLVLLSSVEVVGSSNFTFTLEMFSQKRAQKIVRSVERCEICNASEANDALSRAVEQLANDATKKLVAAPAAVAANAAGANASATVSAPVLVRPPARALVTASISLGIVGVFAVAGGATLLALDGHSHGTIDAGNLASTKPKYQTATSGGVVVGLGAAAVVSAAVLGWWSTIAPTHAAHALILPTANGAAFVTKF